MPLPSALLSFAAVSALLTITPGLDTALVLRYAGRYGRGSAIAAAIGINAGIFVWGVAAALGLSVLVAASHTAYSVLRWLGAAYMIYLGTRMAYSALRGNVVNPSEVDVPTSVTLGAAFRTGFFVNILNPKVGAFYLALLPQFLVPGIPAALMGVMLALVHNLSGLTWFILLALLMGRISTYLQKPSVQRAIDGTVGTLLIAFGAKLALSR